MFSHTTYRLRAGEFIEKVEQKRHRCHGATGWLPPDQTGLDQVTQSAAIENFDQEYEMQCKRTNEAAAPGFVSCRGRIWPPINLALGGGEDEREEEEEQEDEGAKKRVERRSERVRLRCCPAEGLGPTGASGERERLPCCCGYLGDDSEVLLAITPP